MNAGIIVRKFAFGLARTAGTIRAAARDRRGVSAVEFAMLAPVFGVLLAGGVDVGGLLSTRFSLDGAVTAGSSYALINATSVSSSGASSVASAIGAIVAATSTSTTGKVIVNNGVTANVSAGAVSTSGTAANADACYCPTISGTTVSWGNSVTCGGTCASGGFAGHFVFITTQQTYTPVLTDYGFGKNGTIQVQSLVQVQ